MRERGKEELDIQLLLILPKQYKDELVMIKKKSTNVRKTKEKVVDKDA